MILLDTSALAKLLLDEAESRALRADLSGWSTAGEVFSVSTIAVTELRRLAIRTDLQPARVDPVIRPFRVLRLTEGILQLAGRLPYRHLGTLDALHVATAVTAEAAAIITYDTRQAEAAGGEGLGVRHPGR